MLKQPSEEWSATFSQSKYLLSLIFHKLRKLDKKSHSITHTRPKSVTWFSELSFWCADMEFVPITSRRSDSSYYMFDGTSQLEDGPLVQSANFACNVYLMKKTVDVWYTSIVSIVWYCVLSLYLTDTVHVHLCLQCPYWLCFQWMQSSQVDMDELLGSSLVNSHVLPSAINLG